MKLLSFLRLGNEFEIATCILATCMCEDEWSYYIRTSDQAVNCGFEPAESNIHEKFSSATSIQNFFEVCNEKLHRTVSIRLNEKIVIPYVYENLTSHDFKKYRIACEKHEAIPISKANATTYFKSFITLVAKSFLQDAYFVDAEKACSTLNYDELLTSSYSNIFQAFCCALSHQLWLLQNQNITIS